MADYRVSFDGSKDGMAQLTLYKDEAFQDFLHTGLEAIPESAGMGDQFRLLIKDGEINGLRYDQDLSEQQHAAAQEAIERYAEMLDDQAVRASSKPSDSRVEFHALDVSPPGVWLVVTDDDKLILINAGSTEVGPALNTVLSDRSIERTPDGKIPIDLFVVRYVARNNVFGLKSLYENGYEIQEVVQPADNRFMIHRPGARTPGVADSVMKTYVNDLEQVHGVETISQVSSGDALPIDSTIDTHVLSPPSTRETVRYADPTSGEERFFEPGHPTANGIVLKIWGDRTILINGDIGGAPDVEGWLVDQHDDPETEIDLDSDVLAATQ